MSEILSRKDLLLSSLDSSDQPTPSTRRVLLLASRGITTRQRHLLNDFHLLIPHSHKDSKLDEKKHLQVLNDMADMEDCSHIAYFESRKSQDLYLWLSKASQGPTVKLFVQNVHTMLELNLQGNSLKGSRPILVFDETFDKRPELIVLKDLFTSIFAPPVKHRKTKPFVDHTLSFFYLDSKVWMRHFQIEGEELVEIGPRCVFDVIRVFDGSFGGKTLWQNKEWVSPNELRRAARESKGNEYAERVLQERELKEKKKDLDTEDELDDKHIFQ